MSPPPITAALELAEDAILAALSTLAPAGEAHWGGSPVGTVARLRAYAATPAAAGALRRCYVAQHQDDGGGRVRRLNADSWSGLVVVRVQSALDAEARAGLALVVPALATLAQPAGYRITARYERRRVIPTTDGIITRAAQWRVTIHRAAP